VLKQDSGVCEKLQTIAPQICSTPVIGGLEERLGWLEEGYAEAMRANL
jgi:hypothetical protein